MEFRICLSGVLSICMASDARRRSICWIRDQVLKPGDVVLDVGANIGCRAEKGERMGVSRRQPSVDTVATQHGGLTPNRSPSVCQSRSECSAECCDLRCRCRQRCRLDAPASLRSSATIQLRCHWISLRPAAGLSGHAEQTESTGL